MDNILEYFQTNGVDIVPWLKTAGVLFLGLLLLGSLGRFIFGKKATLTTAVSSAIGILFILAVTVVIKSIGAQFEWFVSPLPFVDITGDTLTVFRFTGVHYTTLCSETLSLVILSFLVNLADRWLPKGKKLFGWIFFRCLTVVIGMALHLVVVYLFNRFLPEGLAMYAPTVLLGLLIILILTGSLKLIAGLMVSSVNPVIGGLYTFFFANAIGRLITRAVLTTAILMLLVYLLNWLGIFALSIAAAALIAYIPFLLIALGLWYLIGKVF